MLRDTQSTYLRLWKIKGVLLKKVQFMGEISRHQVNITQAWRRERGRVSRICDSPEEKENIEFSRN